jgi:hyperosmotically inducible protein
MNRPRVPGHWQPFMGTVNDWEQVHPGPLIAHHDSDFLLGTHAPSQDIEDGLISQTACARRLPPLMFAMAGVAPPAPAEEAGKSIDQTVERTGTKMEETKGALGERAEKAGNYLDDTAITAKIKAEILGDPLLKVLEIHVTTTDGVVRLSGTVD